MTFLVKQRSKESYMQDKLRTKAASTQDGIKFSLLNFDKFCMERFEGRRSEDIIQVANYWKIALYLALLSSGMRIGEAVAIRKKHLKFVYSKDKQVRTRIDIPANLTKTKTGR